MTVHLNKATTGSPNLLEFDFRLLRTQSTKRTRAIRGHTKLFMNTAHRQAGIVGREHENVLSS